MKEIKNGVWPVMITPFTADNQIDFDAVKAIIDWYKDNGVAGVFAVCQSSEMFFLSREERMALAKCCIDYCHEKGMGVVVSGHVATAVEDQIAEAQEIIDMGADSYVFISNQFGAPEDTEETVRERICYLLDHIKGDSFGIYECPYPYKRIISPELLKWIASTGKFAFLKDTCCSLDQLKAKCEAVKGTGLKIYNANGATLLESMRMGVAGYSGVMANFHPDMYAWLCDHFADEDKQEKVEQLMAYLGAASTIECQVYPINAKYHMNLVGVPMTLVSRTKDPELLTCGVPTSFNGEAFPSSKVMEIDQFYVVEQMMRKAFFG
jgi:4-hydroxy-tetrahydrodipicolinate synthase